ncbi:hypothetical protein HK096_006625 [Nowakowskiella sp. JEL0078]|nr:hypothetical protein HK096_006625 [Nowakowskiella sp. JEL0078]
MANPKIAILEADIDAARCKGQHHTASTLVKKYQRKYFPDGSALEYLVSGEAAIHIAIAGKKDTATYDSDEADSQKSFALNSIRVSRNSVSEAISLLTQAVAKSNDAPVVQIWIQAHTLLAWIEFLCGTGSVSADALSRLNSLPKIEFEAIPPTAGNYAKIMWIMKKVLLGWGYLDRKDEKSACESFVDASTSVVAMMNKHNLLNISSPDTDPWLIWAEESIYKAALLTLRHGSIENANDLIAQYIKLVENTPTSHSPARKASIIGTHIRMLIKSTLNTPILPFSRIPHPTIRFNASPTLMKEFKIHLSNYEKIVTSLLKFPRAEDQTDLEKLRTDHIVEVYDWWTMFEASTVEDEAKGDQMERHFRLLDVRFFF